MVVVLEAAAATHGDEPGIPDLGEDHQSAHLASLSAKGRHRNRPPTRFPTVGRSPSTGKRDDGQEPSTPSKLPEPGGTPCALSDALGIFWQISGKRRQVGAYRPFLLVELRGFEPLTSAMRTQPGRLVPPFSSLLLTTSAQASTPLRSVALWCRVRQRVALMLTVC